MKSRYTFIILTAFLINACGGSKKEDLSDPLGINGLWAASCYFDDKFNNYNNEEFQFSGNSWTAHLETFDDSDCIGSPITQFDAAGTFSIGETIITSSGLQAIEFNLVIHFNGEDVEAFDLIRVDGNTLNWGGINSEVRPTDINFNVSFTKQ